MSAASDIAKAKQLRADAKSVKDAGARQAFLDAADRVERRAARGARKIGRKSKRKAVSGGDTGNLRQFGRG